MFSLNYKVLLYAKLRETTNNTSADRQFYIVLPGK